MHLGFFLLRNTNNIRNSNLINFSGNCLPNSFTSSAEWIELMEPLVKEDFRASIEKALKEIDELPFYTVIACERKRRRSEDNLESTGIARWRNVVIDGTLEAADIDARLLTMAAVVPAGASIDQLHFAAVMPERKKTGGDFDEGVDFSLLVEECVELVGCRFYFLGVPFLPVLRILSMMHGIDLVRMRQTILTGESSFIYNGNAAPVGGSEISLKNIAVNDSQLAAIRAVLESRQSVFLIHGPPGN